MNCLFLKPIKILTRYFQPRRPDVPPPDAGQLVLGLADVLLVGVVGRGVVDQQVPGLQQRVLAPRLPLSRDLDGSALLV